MYRIPFRAQERALGMVNARFAVMCAHYLFDPDFCNVASGSGWEKGIVEKNVQDSRRRIWLDAQDCMFHTFEELNVWLGPRRRALWSELPHPQYNGLTVADVLELERVAVIADETMIASHERLFDRDQVSYDWQHYIPLIERKPGALRNGAPFADLPKPLQLLKRSLRDRRRLSSRSSPPLHLISHR